MKHAGELSASCQFMPCQGTCQLCQDRYSACELSRSYSDFGDVADCLETDAGSEVEECEAWAQLDELSHQLLSASISSESGR